MTEKKDGRIGKQLWKARKTHGRTPTFKTPEDLWEAACKYFEWSQETPLEEHKLFHNMGQLTKGNVPLMRAMTVQGLCLHLGITRVTFYQYEKKEGFEEVVQTIKDVMFDQKFTGAAAGLLNHSIIARDLGLVDKTKTEMTGADGGSIKIDSTMDANEAAKAYKALLEK